MSQSNWGSLFTYFWNSFFILQVFPGHVSKQPGRPSSLSWESLKMMKLCSLRPLLVRSVLESISGALLCDCCCVGLCLHCVALHCAGGLSGRFCLFFCWWQLASLRRAKGWNGHMQYAWRWWTIPEDVNTCVACILSRNAKGGVLAGCGALSRPPPATGGVCRWPADWAKWFFSMIPGVQQS